MILTVQERAELQRQLKSLSCGFRFEAGKRWVTIEAVPDGITWIVFLRWSNGLFQEGCVNGDDRLEGELVEILEQAKTIVHQERHGAN